ncbi:MAG: hypothetical protein NW205_12475 [Hyphomicrobiaceae bacterium]|nr:hypothetical protein [Hyphomicrobiaceae bacterium]
MTRLAIGATAAIRACCVLPLVAAVGPGGSLGAMAALPVVARPVLAGLVPTRPLVAPHEARARGGRTPLLAILRAAIGMSPLAARSILPRAALPAPLALVAPVVATVIAMVIPPTGPGPITVGTSRSGPMRSRATRSLGALTRLPRIEIALRLDVTRRALGAAAAPALLPLLAGASKFSAFAEAAARLERAPGTLGPSAPMRRWALPSRPLVVPTAEPRLIGYRLSRPRRSGPRPFVPVVALLPPSTLAALFGSARLSRSILGEPRLESATGLAGAALATPALAATCPALPAAFTAALAAALRALWPAARARASART